MNRWKEFRATIPRGQCGVIVQRNIIASLTGAHSAYIAKNNAVKLHYMDGSTETATLTDAEINAGLESWFAMVGAVQERRKDKQLKIEDAVAAHDYELADDLTERADALTEGGR